MLKHFLLFSCLLTSTIYSQKLSSSKINDDATIIKKIQEFKSVNNDSLLFYSKKLQESRDLCNSYMGKLYQSLYYYYLNDYEASKKLSKNIVKDLQYENDYCFKKLKIEALNRLFWIHKNQNNFHLAYHNLLEIEKILASIQNKKGYQKDLKQGIRLGMASIKSLLGYDDEALVLLKGIIAHYKNNQINNEHTYYSKILNQACAYNLIGKVFLNKIENEKSKELDSASFYFKKAYEVAQKFNPPHENSETLYQLREAKVLLARKEYKKTLELINTYSKYQKEFNTSQNINSLKAICFHNLNVSDSALVYARKYLKYYKNKGNNKNRLIAIYDVLANQYNAEKRVDSAFKYSKLSLEELKIFEQNKHKVNKTHFLYNKKNIQDLNKKILEKEKINYLKVISIIIIMAIIIILFFVKRNKKIKLHLSEIEKSDQEIVKTIPKKEYNINSEIEENILAGLKDLKNSTIFLNPNFNIKTFAQKLNTNTTYLSYVINKTYQKSFKEYLIEIRIEYLIEKLQKEKEHKKYTIKFLGEQIGYTNASAFTRAFKKYKGVTPSEFIKNLG